MSDFSPDDVRGLARLISQVEDRDREAFALLSRVYEAADGGYCLGVTGPPGAGKSTLVDQLIRRLRGTGGRVGVLAIDPSSPFSGGAVLGDRVRMQAHANDPGVYIRSIGSRGAHGGLSRAARDIVRIYRAYRFDWIIVETVGVGQTELAIMAIADTTLVVLVPEAGDTIQTMKAGLLEIADLFIVNKADRAGADQIAQALAAMVAMSALPVAGTHEDHDTAHHMMKDVSQTTNDERRTTEVWHIPVLNTVATTGQGIDDVMRAIDRHRAYTAQRSDAGRARERLREEEFLDVCQETLRQRLVDLLATGPLKKLVDEVRQGKSNPYRAAAAVMKKLL